MTIQPLETASRRPQIWAVGGGKGGTGKSLVAASLGIHLARTGHRVILVDGDLGAPNLHTILGLDAPPLALGDYLKRRCDSIEEVVTDTGLERLSLISGARNSLDADNLKHFQKTKLLRTLIGLQADIVLLDLGAGMSLNVLDLFSLADRSLLVVLPEPTSVENCYRFLKAAFLRRLHHLGRTLGYQSIIDLVMQHRELADDGRPSAILDEIARIDSSAAAALSAHAEAFLPQLVINQARAREDETLGESMAWAAERFIRVPMRYAGAIPYDPVLVRCVKGRRPYLAEYPRAHTAGLLRAIAESVLTHSSATARPVPGPWIAGGESYRALELSPGASQEEILEAYLRLRRALRSDSPALAPLDCETERRAAIAEVEHAYRALSRNLSSPAARPAHPTPLVDLPRPRSPLSLSL